MIFDKACGIVERYLPELKPIFDQAKLFYYDALPEDVIRKKEEPYTQEDLDLFALPFPIVALEDMASLVVFVDHKEDNLGGNHRRMFIDIISTSVPDSYFAASKKESDRQIIEHTKSIYGDGTIIFCIGEMTDIFLSSDKEQFGIVSRIDKFFGASKNEIVADMEFGIEPPPKGMGYSTTQNLVCAIEELLYLNTPKNYIFETTPQNVKHKKKRGKKIVRSHERPIYTFLDLEKTRRLLGHKIDDQGERGSHRSPIPHFRRRHLRRLKKESGYKENKIIVVNSSWVGPSEKIENGKKYKVRLDL